MAFLSKRKDVDQQRLVVMGHSFGGALALLAAEHNPQIKAVVVFGAAAYSWDRSPALRARLITDRPAPETCPLGGGRPPLHPAGRALLAAMGLGIRCREDRPARGAPAVPD